MLFKLVKQNRCALRDHDLISRTVLHEKSRHWKTNFSKALDYTELKPWKWKRSPYLDSGRSTVYFFRKNWHTLLCSTDTSTISRFPDRILPLEKRILAALLRLVCMRSLCLKFLYSLSWKEIITYIKPLSVCTKTSNYLFDLGYIVYLMNVNCLCRAWFSCNKTHATIYHFCLYYPYSALTVYSVCGSTFGIS